MLYYKQRKKGEKMAEKQSAGKFFNFCKKMLYIVTIPFFIIILLSTVIILGAKSNNGVPSFMGSQAIKIEKETMLPDFNIGDVVLVQKVSAADLVVGDKIAYYEYLDESETGKNYSEVDFNTIIAIEKLQNPTDKQLYGKIFFQLQGTNSTTPEDGWIMEDFVVGKLSSQNGFMENFLVFCSSTAGMAILAVVPGLIVLALIVIFIIGYKKAAKLAAQKDAEEAQEKMVQLQQEEQQAKQQEKQAVLGDKFDLEALRAELKSQRKVAEPVKAEPRVEPKTTFTTPTAEPKVVAQPEPKVVSQPVTPRQVEPKPIAPQPVVQPAQPKSATPPVAPTAPKAPTPPAPPKAPTPPAPPKVPTPPVQPKAPTPPVPPAPPKAPPAPPRR